MNDKQEQPITHGGVDRGHKLCKCSECGTVATCTPLFDFYTRAEAGLSSELVCEVCIMGGRNPYSPIKTFFQNN